MRYLLGMVTAVVVVVVLFGLVSVFEAPVTGPTASAPAPDPAAAPPETGSGDAAPAMRRYVSDALGFAIDIPEEWQELDKETFRRLLAQYQNVADERARELSVSSLIFGVIEAWPENRPVASLVVNHHAGQRRDVTAILETVLEFKDRALVDVTVLEHPTPGTLGGFKGGYIRTRDRMRTAVGTVEEEATLWVLWVSNGYMMITANAPADDEAGQRMIERMLGSFRDTVGG